ncbi:MAG TPA: amidohydrolase family protein [Actinomycetes bacterium]|jgi:imidazolonepropionase-like amidohydrolase|nr:amidohydrolase family protein [Actinomycetes bacterium]
MTLVLGGGTLIDGTGADPVGDTVVVVEGELLTRVGHRAAFTAEGAEMLDCDGLTLLPGLIDAHSHLGLIAVDAPERVPPAVAAARIFRNCELALDAGFTTVRDVAGIDGGVAQAVAEGLVRGPRILPSGPILSQTGGHGDHAPAFLDASHYAYEGIAGISQINVTCDGPDQVRLAARRAFRHGATQIKVCVSGGVVSFTDRLEDAQLTVAELRAAVEEAEARGTYVTAHAHNVRGILNGLEAGVSCYEHGTFLDEATARRMAEAGADLVPTFAVLRLMTRQWRDWGVPEAVLPRLAGVEDAMAASMKLATAAGVRVGSGSDLLGPRQEHRGLELVIKSELLDPMAAVTSATSVNATILRLGERIGRVAEGLVADVVAVDGDPLAEPSLFDDPDRVVLVVKGGQVVKDTRR